MATTTWDGANTSWNTNTNWDTNSVPGVGDDVVFDSGNAQACTLDVNAECDSITNTNYAGTLDGDTFDIDIGGDFQFGSGSLDLGTGTWTVAGNWDTDGMGGEFTEGTGEVKMTGTTKTISVVNNQDFYSLNIDTGASVTLSSGDAIVLSSGVLTVAGTFTLLSTMNMWSGNPTSSISGTIDGGGAFNILSGGVLDTGGTLSCGYVQFYISGGNIAVPARTYDCEVRITNADNSARTATVSAGTLTVNDNLYINANGNDPGHLTVDCATNDPTVDISGDLDFTGSGSASEILQAGDGTWNVGGDIDLTAGALTAAASEVILDGAGTQDITSDTEAFYDLTVAQANDVVAFVDALNVTNVCKGLTQDAVIEWTDGVAYVMNTTNFAGAAGHLITFQPSIGANAYTFEVTTNDQMDHVDVSWCDATPGIDIAATNSNDGGDNTAWTFGGVDDSFAASALALTGAQAAPTPVWGGSVSPSALGLTGTGQAPTPIWGGSVSPAALGLTGAQGAPDILFDWTEQLSAALALTSTAQTPGVVIDYVHALGAALGITGSLHNPTVLFDFTVEIAAALGLTGTLQTPTTLYDFAVAIAAAQSLAGAVNSPTLIYDYAVQLGAALNLSAATQDPTVTYDFLHSIAAPLGITGTAQDPTVFIGLLVQIASALGLTSTAQTPTVAYDLTTAVEVLALSLGQESPEVAYDVLYTATVLALAAQQHDPTVTAGQIIAWLMLLTEDDLRP